MKKRNIILLASIVVVLIAIIGLILAFSWMPISGLRNSDDISVNSYFNESVITLDVKVKKALLMPNYNKFNTSLSIEEMCKSRAETPEGNYSYDYKLYGKHAIIYKNYLRGIARAQLCDLSDSDDKQRYILTAGVHRFQFSEIVMDFEIPYYLTRDTSIFDGGDELLLDENYGFGDVIEFYASDSHYDVINQGNAATVTVKSGRNSSVRIEYDAAQNSVKYSANLG